jgi:hypothetical protein
VRSRNITWVLLAVTLGALAAASPHAVREAMLRGQFYLFSSSFFEDLPLRLSGPGRLRFVFQPAVAILLGIRAGRDDHRAGRPPYGVALLLHPKHRRTMFRDMLSDVVNLISMGVLADLVAQWLILGNAYPGAAVVVGPVVIALPYSIARALANRTARLTRA